MHNTRERARGPPADKMTRIAMCTNHAVVNHLYGKENTMRIFYINNAGGVRCVCLKLA
jgi:hypothetical protein